MKTKFFTLTCALFLMFLQSASAECTSCNAREESLAFLTQKTYLTLDQITFHDSKIYVQLGEDVLVVSAIYSDAGGFFIKKNNICAVWEWKCGRCGLCVDGEQPICPVCKK